MNKALFGAIIVLMLAIAGIGTWSLFASHTPSPSSSTAQTAASQTGEDEYDGGDDESAEQASDTNTASSSNASTSGSTNGGITMAQVKQHNSASSCYTAINGDVYDVTSWISQHPGGAQAILSLCGTDGSAAFDAQHGGQRRPASELASFKIGTLAQ